MNRAEHKAFRKDQLARMTPLGKLFFYSGAVRYHKDGSTCSGYYRWWHPMTWIAAIIFIPVCVFTESTIQEVLPLRLDAYWRKKKDEIIWL